jgi:hypothetical protein
MFNNYDNLLFFRCGLFTTGGCFKPVLLAGQSGGYIERYLRCCGYCSMVLYYRIKKFIIIDVSDILTLKYLEKLMNLLVCFW